MKSLYIKILIFVCIINYTVHSIPPPKILTEQSIKKYNELKEIMKPKSEVSKSSRSSSVNHAPSLNKAPVPRFNWNGTVKLIVIPMQFTDVTFTEDTPEQTKSKIREGLFGTGENSLASFYNRSSYGKMNVEELIITDVVTSAHDMSYYGSPWDDSAGGTLPVEALDLAYANDDDFQIIAENPQNYGNGDEYIMGVEALNMGKTLNDIDNIFLMIIHAGGAQENTGAGSDIWSHQWTINGDTSGHIVGNATFYAYSTFAEFNTENGSPVSIACHEFGHQLGASDFYGKTSSDGTGKWSLMDSGVWNGYYALSKIYTTEELPYDEWWGSDFDGYHKELFGWLDAVEMNILPEGTNEITVKSISDLSNLNDSYKIYKFFVNSDKSEYFIFYVKEKTHYDRYLNLNDSGDSGLTILHIDENIKYTDDKIYLDNTSFSRENSPDDHMAVWLVRADNNLSSISERKDLFPYDPYFENKKQDFTPATSPSSYGYYSLNAPILKDISRNTSNSDISFKFINKKTWTVSLASNPFDSKFIHLYARPNYNPEYDSIEVLLDYNQQDYKIPMKSQNITFSVGSSDLSGSVTKYIMWSGEKRLSDIPTGSFSIVVNEYDQNSNTVNSVNAYFDFLQQSFPLYSVSKNIVFDGNEINSDSNMIFYQEYIEATDELEPLYSGRIISEKSPSIKINNNRSVFLVEKDGNWVITEQLSNSFKGGFFKDREAPSITLKNSREFVVVDKYSGLKNVKVTGISGKNYNLYNNDGNFYIVRPPDEDIVVEATDNFSNRASLLVKKAPSNFSSVEIYPNPAESFLNIKYNLSSVSMVSIDFLDINGKKIFTAKDPTGSGFYSWDLKDKRGDNVANGVYFIKLHNGFQEILKKVAIIK